MKPFYLWEHTGSNRGPSACKADALNQLSYAPSLFWDCKDKGKMFSAKFFQEVIELIILEFKKINLFLFHNHVNLRQYKI